MDGTGFARARAELGKSQRELAAVLGVSLKAVESYEQGWRKVPDSVERLLYYLVLRMKGAAAGLLPCWKLRNCGEEARAGCLARVAGEGAYCWFLTGRTCASAAAAERAGLGERYCYSCPCFRRLLDRARMPRGFAGEGE